MQMQNPHQNLEIPSGMRGKLEEFRRRVWIIKLAEGISAGICGLMLSYIVVFALDRVWDTPAWVRGLILISGTAALAIGFPLKWHRWVWQTRQLEQVARILRHRYPRLGDQMLGIVELVKSEVEQERSEALCRAAMRQVDRETRKHDFSGAVPNPKHRQWTWAAIVPLVLFLVGLIFVPAASRNALARWLMPWMHTERYTFAQLEYVPNEMVVPFAEPFTLSAKLKEKTKWSPEGGAARYGKQDPVRADLKDGGYDFSMPPQKDADDLVLAIGDARKQVAIKPTTRPELTSLSAIVELPEYLQYTQDLVKDVRGGTVSMVKGSRTKFEGTATRALEEASIDGQSKQVDVQGERLTTKPITVDKSMKSLLTWQDILGLPAKQPFVLNVIAQDDEAPNIACGDLPRQKVVLQTEVLSFTMEASDDFGVRQVGIEWSGIEDALRNPNPSSGEKLLAAGQPEMKNLQAVGSFSADRLGIKAQTLKMRMFAVDYKPDRDRSYSPTYILHVLSPEEHAIWVTAQLRKWFSQAQDVYEREQQLYEVNQELRKMAAEQIDRPENRRRIETQAAAEQTNARRLSALTSVGEQLINEATKNDQFNVETLENWANMLNTLNDIAGNRMPSVADLLKQAAAAPGSSQPGKPGESQPSQPAEPSKSGPKVGVNRDGRSGKGGDQESDEPKEDMPVVPTIIDVESSFNELKEDDSEQPPSKSQPSFGLPGTVVQGGGADQEPSEACPAQEKVEEAVEQQEDLLAEFAKVAEELQKILNNLEGSTFVKRLKAASRRQLEIAGELNGSLMKTFGFSPQEVDGSIKKQSENVAQREIAQSDNVYVIQEDLEAYFNRVQQGKYKTVANEMRESRVVNELNDLADIVRINFNGQSIAQAEFWADALDRWAEQLVGPG